MHLSHGSHPPSISPLNHGNCSSSSVPHRSQHPRDNLRPTQTTLTNLAKKQPSCSTFHTTPLTHGSHLTAKSMAPLIPQHSRTVPGPTSAPPASILCPTTRGHVVPPTEGRVRARMCVLVCGYVRSLESYKAVTGPVPSV